MTLALVVMSSLVPGGTLLVVFGVMVTVAVAFMFVPCPRPRAGVGLGWDVLFH